ncbi:hypothetical protein LCGC14_0875650 [marine sediment metagenome]|uniref:Uncharacterized protein n=1 Tax=marine sediment metagenome TaxID=412755 RepID=A0A0F9RN54_9ZZZZ
MAELVYQTWERITGRPWSDAHAGGFTTGTYDENIALQKRLLGGWNPYAPKAKPAPKPAPRRQAAAARPAATPAALQIEPGMWLRIQEELMKLEREIAAEQIRVQEEQQAQLRRTTELQYATSPIDFVAYELYKRELEGQGFDPMAASRSDVDIQAMMEQLVGGEGETGRLLGEFGVDIPGTEQWSRSQFRGLAQSEQDVLSSFLRAGVETGGGEVSIDPGDYYRRLAEGFVPTLQKPTTQYRF